MFELSSSSATKFTCPEREEGRGKGGVICVRLGGKGRVWVRVSRWVGVVTYVVVLLYVY